jgi:hypothetical protein
VARVVVVELIRRERARADNARVGGMVRVF